MAKIGWAYDLKTVNDEIIKRRKNRSGDGTFTTIWGWSDRDQNEDEMKIVKIISARTHKD